MSTLRPGCNTQLAVAKVALKCVQKHGHHTTWCEHWKLMTTWCGHAVAALLRQSRSSKQTDKKFLDLNKDLLMLFIDKSLVDTAKSIGNAPQNRLRRLWQT